MCMCNAHCARSNFSKRIEDDGGEGAQLVSASKLNADKAGRCRIWCRENRQHDERRYGKHVILQFFIYQLLCNNGLSPYSSGERRDTGRRRRRHRGRHRRHRRRHRFVNDGFTNERKFVFISL